MPWHSETWAAAHAEHYARLEELGWWEPADFDGGWEPP